LCLQSLPGMPGASSPNTTFTPSVIVRKARSAPSLSPAKRRFFLAAMWLMPIVLYVLLEGGLRLAGYASSYPLFQPVPGFENYLYKNQDVARCYLSHQARKAVRPALTHLKRARTLAPKNQQVRYLLDRLRATDAN